LKLDATIASANSGKKRTAAGIALYTSIKARDGKQKLEDRRIQKNQRNKAKQ
jgi:hypothetical protein